MVDWELLELWQPCHARPTVLGGRPEQLEDSFQLIVHVRAGIERPARVSQLRKNAARTPHVDARRVQLGAEQDIWWAVPETRVFVIMNSLPVYSLLG